VTGAVSDDTTVVWVSPSEGRDDATHALREWARARGVVLVPASSGGSRALEVDMSLAERIEKELDRAREAIAALDADPAERALARAEALLRDHPELPQAAFLRAEVHRRWATRFSRVEPRDEARAQAEWQEADALDGGRVAGVGETSFPPRRKTAATLAVSGAGKRRLVVRLDGLEITGAASAEGTTSFALDVPAAEHHVGVTLDDEQVFASWIAIADTAPDAPRPTIPINVGDSGACSAKTFSRVARDESGGIRAPSVSCDRWVAAIPSERRGAVLVARCERDGCGPLLEWRVESSLGAGAPADIPIRHAWPAWATWTMVGVGVVAVAVTTVVATGVLETRPVEQRFVSAGVKVE